MMLDNQSMENLKPYFWIYAPIASDVKIKKPKKWSHHQTVSDLIRNDPVLENKKRDRFWDKTSIIPLEKRKVILWEQTHPLPNGSPFPEQPIYDLDQARILAHAVSETVNGAVISWGGKGIAIGRNMTSASLSLAFNDEADRDFYNFLEQMNEKISSTGLDVGDHRAGTRRAVVKLAKRAISKHHGDEVKDIAEKLTNKFGRMTTNVLDIQDVRLGMSLYNGLGERVRSNDVAIIQLSNGCVKWQQKSVAKQILAPTA
jgi:hypothetical protein